MNNLLKGLKRLLTGRRTRRWAVRTLVIGPAAPVDGDSVSCTKAMLNLLRSRGLEAYTLPTLAMYPQISWILQAGDYHPAALITANQEFVTTNLQEAYDALIESWRPDEIILLDGPISQIGFDPRGVRVYNIDHHIVEGEKDDKFFYVKSAPSVGCLLIEEFGLRDPILAVSILTDTFWLRENMPARAAQCLSVLCEKGGLTDDVFVELQKRMMVRQDPELVTALHEADLRVEGDLVFAVLKNGRPVIHRLAMAHYGRFFTNVCVARPDGYVSFKTTNKETDLRPIAIEYGGGGHKGMAAAHLPSDFGAELCDKLYADFVKVCTLHSAVCEP